MKYPMRKEFRKYYALALPGSSLVLNIANAFMTATRKGKRPTDLLRKETIEFSGCSALLFSPKNVENPPLFVYYHGGGFMMEASPFQNNLVYTYAIETGCAVLAVNYRLAPKYKFPIPVNDCFEAYRWALQQKKYPKILVGGDSAGGSLSLAVVQMAHNEALPQPEALMLIYPVCDSRMETESMKLFPDTPMWDSRRNENMYHQYTDEAHRHDPLVSAMEAPDLSFLPPTYLETAEFDCLRDEALNLAKRLKAEGVSLTLNETQGTIHAYDIAERSEYVKEQVKKRIDFMKKHFSA